MMRLTLFYRGNAVVIEGDVKEVLNRADEKVVKWQDE